jgi:hypothetical protein
MRGDDLLQRDVARSAGNADEPRQQRRHLHACEPTLARRRVADDHREVQRQVGDVRERMRGIDREGSEDGEDAILEHARQEIAGVVVEVVPVGELDAGVLQCRREILGEDARLARHELLHPTADRAELFDLIEAIGRCRTQPRRQLLLDARHAHLEELVEVRAEDREELRALEQRKRGIFRQGEDAGVEVEPGQLTIQVPSAFRCEHSGATHALMVRGEFGDRSRHLPGEMRRRIV